MKTEFSIRDIEFLKRYSNKKIMEIEIDCAKNEFNIYDSEDYNCLRIIYQKTTKMLEDRAKLINQD